MHNKIPVLLALAFLSACEGEPFVDDLGDDPLADEAHGAAGDEPQNAIDVARMELARIDVGNGEVVFSVDAEGPDKGAISILETMVPDKQGALQIREATDDSALTLFLRLTDGSVPVPRALVDIETDPVQIEAAAARGLVERIDGTLSGLVGELPPVSNWSAAYMCSEGTTSAQFLNEICSVDAHWTLDYCHNGTWYSVTDDTFDGHKAEWSRGRTLACNGNGRQRHYYRFGGVWYKPIDKPIPSGNLYRYTRKSSVGVKLRRKITHSRTGSAFVRATSHFFRFPF